MHRCFLLLQAFLERAGLPISDYVNDTKSVIENVPRLLAAMQYISEQECSTAGSFEMICQFYRTRQLLETRTKVSDDPMVQLPGINQDFAQRLFNECKKDGTDPLQMLRSLSRNEAVNLIKRVSRGKVGAPIRPILGQLYSFPLVSLEEINVIHNVEKSSGKSVGTLKISLKVQRELKEAAKEGSRKALSLTLVLGSWVSRRLLSLTSIPISRDGSWTVSKEMYFDWNEANADGGEEGGFMMLRVLLDGVRGLDWEMVVGLQ